MHGYKVLIVDDDVGDRKLLRRLFKGLGMVIDLAEAESVDAAQALSDQPFDAIFLDHQLPATTGLSALANFREIWPRTAIFMMTGFGDESIAKSAILEGASDYLIKSTIDETTVLKLLKSGVESARLRARMEEQREDLATFAEVLVHDFRAPIRAAAFLSQQIREDLDDGEIEDVKHGLSVLETSASQMMDMLKSLSDHVRFDREDIAEHAAPIDLITRALKTLEYEVTEATAKIEIQPGSPENPVICKPPQVAQVLQNLIANAIKFSGNENPSIRVSTSLLGCDEMLFEISDNGIGVPNEFLNRVFEPFKRVPGNGRTKGTGLGLATCKKVIDRHGGRIWCESDGVSGTQMRFTLPLAAAIASPHDQCGQRPAWPKVPKFFLPQNHGT